MQTLVYYYDYPEVDNDRLRDKVEKFIYNARPWVTNPDCEKEVEEAYNYHTTFEEKQAIAHLVKEERMRRKAELAKENSERAYERTQKGVQGFIKGPVEAKKEE